ncbi:MAG: Pvc16 family protein [Paracoccaceae bacterium]
MPVPVSSLSVAVQGIADFLDSQFGEDVVISVNNPFRAAEQARGSNSTAHLLNLFVYRVAPSGFHAGAGADETQFIRINTLLTPFPVESDTVAADADLRILGHAIRALQNHPVLPIGAAPLPGAAITEPPGRLDYRLEAIMQAPPMEELNHIWTTQGGELAYRLSVAYEFALIPIEPFAPRIVADPPRSLILDAEAGMTGAELEFVPISSGSRAIPLQGAAPGDPPLTNWLPVQMLVDGDALTNRLAIAAAVNEVTIALAGPAGEDAAIEVVWTLGGGATSTQAAQIIPMVTALLDEEAARAPLSLSAPAGAQSAVILARPAAAGAPVMGSPFANILTLTVT